MNIAEECFKEIIEMVEALIEEADHHANKKNPVVKITDKNYQIASGKSLPGPFNKNHVGQYIVYNKDTDASYLVTPDNWKKSKIKKDLESQGKFYEALEETMKLLELFDRPDLLDDIDTLLGSPVKKTFKKVIQGVVSKTEFKIKNGKLKIKKVKLKSDVADNIDKLSAKVMSDTVPVQVRKKINKEVRKDINPAKGAHNPVADMKAELSKGVGRDLDMDMT